MTLGMIVRADAGGIANQSWHLWRCLQPDVTVLVLMGDKGRDAEHPGRFPDAHHSHGGLTATAANLLAECDLTLTIEGLYNPDEAQRSGLRAAIIANPELWTGHEPYVQVAVHTPWERGRIPHADVLPYPAPVDQFVRRTDLGPGFYHPAAPAMADRNGTQVVLSALYLTTVPQVHFIRSDDPPPWAGRKPTAQLGAATVHWLRGRTGNPVDAYPPECSTLVLPRRYGGLCLPAIEAACLGWDAVMPDLCPQDEWPWVLRHHAGRPGRVQTKGGRFQCWQPDAKVLAQTLDATAADAAGREARRAKGTAWVEANAWPMLADRYRAWLATRRNAR